MEDRTLSVSMAVVEVIREGPMQNVLLGLNGYCWA